MKHYLLFLSLMLFSANLFSQRVTISGYISDKESGERLINANLYDKVTYLGTTANDYGFYSISLPKGERTLVASFIGFKPQEFKLNLQEDISLNINLELESDELDEVTVIGNQINKVEDTQMSMVDLPIQKLKKIPVILGESDVLKVMQLLPGVQSGTEGTSGIYVRGGGPDQNLFLLDGVPVYNASHLMGFFSVFNPDALKTVKLYKGGFPARFGGRLSSVVDISMKDGNMKKFKGNFSIGLISSKLTLEGPIIKDKTSFMFSGRRTYADVLAQPFIAIMNKSEDSNLKMWAFFHDINLKVNHIFSDRSRLYWSGYHGRDKAHANDKYDDTWGDNRAPSEEYEDKFGLGWGNTISSLRWNYLINPKLFSNTTLTYSKYFFDIEVNDKTKYIKENKTDEYYFKYYSGIEDITAKIDFDYFPTPKHSIKFGTYFTRHHFSPGVTTMNLEGATSDLAQRDTSFGNRSIYANELCAFIEDDFSITPKLKMNAGVHISVFNVNGTIFVRPQPRLSLRYLANNYWSLKASYSRMAQHVHLLSTSSINLPTDLWVPVTKRFEPPISDQIALGTAINLPKGFSFTLEGFYKNMLNLIEYKEGASFMGGGDNFEDKIENGRGWSYGVEVMLEKTIGKTTGWIGYTWAKTERQFDKINFGDVFPAKYDRRHDISVVITHEFSDKFDIGATWVYGTGTTATLALTQFPTSNIPYRYPYSDNTSKVYEGRNNYRLPAFHRLDVGMNFHKKKKNGVRTWSISAYNAYNHKNPFMLHWKQDWESYNWDMGTSGSQTRLYKLSLFPIIPSVSYSFKF